MNKITTPVEGDGGASAQSRSLRDGQQLSGLAAGPGSGPLYLQLANVLRDEIVSGVHPVGSLLPTEDNLCERFSVSRYTVREALRLLREDGLVASRRGAGTVVVPPGNSDSDIHQVMSINDLVAFAGSTRLVISSVKMVALDARLAVRAGLTKGEEWLQVKAFRHEDGVDVPVCYTEYYINRDYAAVGRLLHRHNGPIFPLIEDLFGQSISEVNQQISATLLSPELAREFREEPAAAALEVRRSYKTTDQKVAQVTINVHPASRYQHSMTMRRMKA